jgi:hypothetical protein
LSNVPSIKKLPDSESFDVVKSAREGLEEALYWHTVGILADSGTTLGTAVAIRWNKHCIFLTANHVIRKTSDKNLRGIGGIGDRRNVL